MSPKWLKRILVLVGIVVVVLLLRFTVFAPEPVPVSVYTVQQGRVEETLTNSKAGTVKVRQRARMSPEMGGRVAYLGVREGDRVKAGTLLLRLEDSELRASLEVAERAYKSGQSAAREACVVADLAGRELERNRVLHQGGMISDSVLDQLSNRFEAARVRCETAKVDTERAGASVSLARATLKKTELRTPFEGIITEVTTEVGEWVSPSPPAVPIPPVITLQNENSIYVEAPMDEADVGRLRAGLPVRVSLAPFPSRFFQGKVVQVAPYVEDIQGQNRTVDIEAEFTDKVFSRSLLPGTSADLEVILDAHEKVLRIPTYVLLEGNRVLLVSGKRLVTRNVQTGLRNWEFVEIREGLKEGDRVATSLDRPEVKEGALIRITQEVER